MGLMQRLAKGLPVTGGLGILLLVLPGYVAPAEPQPLGAQVMSATVQVYVSGAVRRPGVYRLPAGTRVLQAIYQSGGLLPGVPLEQLSLTRLLVDGEHIHVLPKPVQPPVSVVTPGQAWAPPARGRQRRATAPRPVASIVSLNQATVVHLDGLPGIGRKRAIDIVSFRQRYGPFRRIDDLRRIPGLGPKLIQRLRPYLRV